MVFCVVVFFFKQKTAYEMCISDWSSDVCSSDLTADGVQGRIRSRAPVCRSGIHAAHAGTVQWRLHAALQPRAADAAGSRCLGPPEEAQLRRVDRSEEHTSELQSLMRISYAVFCLKKKQDISPNNPIHNNIIRTT